MLRFLLLLALIPTLLSATAQQPERLRIDGQEVQLMATPLEEFWNAAHPKPASLTQTSWSCWRGYIGTWEIIGGKLHLLHLKRNEIRPKDDSFEEVVVDIPLQPLLGADCPAPATWFTGVLRVARGKVLKQVNTGFATVYREDLYLSVEQGVVIDRRIVKNDPDELTSECDLAWRETGRISPTGGITAVLPEDRAAAEAGDWIESTELPLRRAEFAATKKTFTLRGIHLKDRIWFPGNRDIDANFPLDTTALAQVPPTGVAIEATCTLVEAKDGPHLVASEIIQLPPGSAIQRMRPAAAARLAADTTAGE